LALVVGYIFSPIALIPDFGPTGGYLEELLLIPVFVTLARRIKPAEVLAEHRVAAQSAPFSARTHWFATTIIVVVWITIAAGSIHLPTRLFESSADASRIASVVAALREVNRGGESLQVNGVRMARRGRLRIHDRSTRSHKILRRCQRRRWTLV
jgi:uncharacterized membrane protein YkvA (DUF1232 family)